MEVTGTAERAPQPSPLFHRLVNPGPEDIGATAVEFLRTLPGPTHIHIHGKNRQRSRAVATLLHGNEPSGLFAIHDVLRQKIRPLIDMHFFILNVDAAKQSPGFIYRMLPHHKDLNRCFNAPFDDSDEDELAQALLGELARLSPESLIDIHNTSGSSPSFGVTTFMDELHDSLVSLFTHRLIVTDLRLGALMEVSDAMMPTVTIECGGAQDRESNLLATEGLIRYMTIDNVLGNDHSDMTLEFFHNPIRMELVAGSDIAFGDHRLVRDGVTLLPDIENFNFGFVDPENLLGFVSGELPANLSAKRINGEQCVSDYFRLEGEELYPRQRLKLFMVTSNPEIARKDCLFYFVEDDD
jgi:hypothetical protein